jgi:hypothetical protein
MIINLSPFYRNIPWVSPFTGLTCTSYTLKIYVWTGLKTSAPIAPHYTITKNNITASTGTDKINFARLVSDFITFSPQTDAGATQLLNGVNQAWVKTEIYYTTTDASELTLPQSIEVELMTNGYTYGLDGENAQPPTNKVLIPVNTYKVYKDTGRFVVPIQLDELPSLIDAVDDTFDIYFQDTLMAVLGNDTLGYQPTSVINVSYDWGATDGTLSIQDNQVKYNKGTVLNTPLSATYTIQDSTGETDTATITINLTTLPSGLLAVDDSYLVTNTGGVQNLMVQDNDSEGTPPTTITAISAGGITSGTIAIDGTNEYIIFTPNGVIPSGTETFTYTLTDTVTSDTATVTLTVKVASGGSSTSVTMQTTGSADGATSCAQPLATLRYHDGTGSSPTLGDFIYTNLSLTTVFAGGDLYYRIPDGRSVQVANDGEVNNLWICGAGPA